jgi:hypothetical protein
MSRVPKLDIAREKAHQAYMRRLGLTGVMKGTAGSACVPEQEFTAQNQLKIHAS